MGSISARGGNVFGIDSWTRLLLVAGIIFICSNELILPMFGSLIISFVVYSWYMYRQGHAKDVPLIGQLKSYIDKMTTEKVRAIAREITEATIAESTAAFK